jgi:glycosyltransferase involved in cell wall biosynthesis
MTKTARVALVCEPPDGGAAAHVHWLAQGLPAHWYETVAVVPRNFAYLDELDTVCEVVTLPFRRDYAHPYDDLRVLKRLLPVLRRTTLVHAHSAKAGALARVAARLVRRPSVYTPHMLPFVGEMSIARRQFGLFVERALAPTTAALICVCEFERRLARQERLRPRRVALVYNGCPPCSGGDSAEMPDGLIVGTLSVLRRQKALEFLLDAMPSITAAVPEAKLVIVGNGPVEPKLRAHAVILGVDATWLPFEPPPARYLRSFDVYVLSSAWEAFPIAVLEAQACGIPQVVTAVGGTRESVVPETGIVVPPRDPAALAEAVIQLLRDPQRRAAMTNASRVRHAERFAVERMVADTAAVYDRVLADN